MTRVIEFAVALLMVLVLAVIVGLFLPTHGHIDRSIEISHNPEHIYDVFNNFRRFDDYVGGDFRIDDPNVKFDLSGPVYGPGAALSWKGNEAIGNGKFVNKSGTIDLAGNSEVVWTIDNDWHGYNKTFTFTVTPRDGQRVSTVNWAYDVQYPWWNLIDRYSRLWINGAPATMVRYGLDSLQNMLAAIPNVDYKKLNPGLYQVPATPVLLVSTKAPRLLDDIDSAKAAALKEIGQAMGELGVQPTGPTMTFATDWGDTAYTFDLAVPINTSTLNVGGKEVDLASLPARRASSSAAPASSANAGAPASASSTGGASATAADDAPGSLDAHNQLIVNANVRARMLPARQVLEAGWTGEAGVPLVRLALQAYAGTHGYQVAEDGAARLYDQLVSLPTVDNSAQNYRVFLPVVGAPDKTPEQLSGRTEPLPALDPSLWAGEVQAAPKKPEARKRAEPAKARHRR